MTEPYVPTRYCRRCGRLVTCTSRPGEFPSTYAHVGVAQDHEAEPDFEEDDDT